MRWSNVDFNAMHITTNPAQGPEIGVARVEEFCGQGHPCSPIKDYFHFTNRPGHPDNVHDEVSWEVKYNHTLWEVPYRVYMQIMNRDYSWFNHSGTGHLFGTSVFLPTNDNPVKLALEYTNSISMTHPFAFNEPIYGYTYTDYKYPDGMHYRGRAIGFGLDTDSQLIALQGSWTDAMERFYELSYYHANIGSSHSEGVNYVSPTPVLLNMGEARLTLPMPGFKVDLAGRIQDDGADGFPIVVANSGETSGPGEQLWTDFVKGRSYRSFYPSNLPPRTVLYNAYSMFGTSYDFIHWNCEHFANACHGRPAQSHQIRSGLLLAAIMGGNSAGRSARLGVVRLGDGQ